MNNATDKIRVLCWSEMTEPAEVYPEGISGAIAKHLRSMPNLEVRAASINDPEQGIGKSALDSTDVLIWWAHRKHKDIEDARAMEAVRQIRERGLGFIAIHSSHYAKIFKTLLDAPCGLGAWREDGQPESLKCVAPSHPIARGIADFEIPQTEMYNEPFQVPPPEATIFHSTWGGGEQFRSCNTWTVGRGRVVYFRPGHETYPIYFQEKPLKVIANCVYWCAGLK
ncbi:MAG TPA: ThuA domain-containing protein [Terriglobia bacterium]|nr:ThuA domain-containing protein [Terriglobia bacterium]